MRKTIVLTEDETAGPVTKFKSAINHKFYLSNKTSSHDTLHKNNCFFQTTMGLNGDQKETLA